MSKNSEKPKKPYRDFPLTAHRNGQWCKKIRGKIWYFGRWDEPDAALTEYLRIRDDLQAGRQPKRLSDGPDLASVCNAFLTREKTRSDRGEISSRTFRDYHDICQLMIEQLGRTTDPEQLSPLDFARFRDHLSSKYAPSRLSKSVGVCRMVMKWAYESDLLTKQPKFGPDFKGASKRAVRQKRADVGQKLFQPATIRLLIDRADEHMRAMILLGINGGLGNSDIANLPQSAVNTDSGWVDFPRPKTGIERRFPLWQETKDAVDISIQNRPAPSTAVLADRVFLTRYGNSWVPEGRSDNQLSAKFRKLLQATVLYRSGCGFYWLRHTFQTIGDEAGDPLATSHIMGHADGTIGGVYRERISGKRLRKVVDYVHDWLFHE